MPQLEPAAFECHDLEKEFSGVRVLRGVAMRVAAGEVLGVAGENGAGKSTLMNLIGGVFRPSAGRMWIGGGGYAPATPAEAAARGVAQVHQELNLFPNLSVADNFFLTAFPRRSSRMPWIDRGETRRRANELLAAVGLNLDPEVRVERLALGERQLLEIARAIGMKARILILDEPTTSLTVREAERLFRIVRDVAARGMAVFYISHHLDHLLRECHRILVLRDGAQVAEAAAGEFDRDSLVRAMVGRSMEAVFPARKERRGAEAPVLEVRGLSQPGVIRDISLTAGAGEVLGIAGLMGSGRSELARILFGLDRAATGEIRLRGEDVSRRSVRERIRRGMAFVTEDRRDDGLFLDQAADPNLRIVTRFRGSLARVMERLAIRTADPLRQPVRQLSGGNQQKVVFGKWTLNPPAVLLLDEPTRGIDVGAKQEIYRAIFELADAGAAVLVISSEIEELIGLCDRILVMRRGELCAAVERAEFGGERLLRAAL